ncbi:MAG: glycosyltransferase family 2 protein [Phycisphaerales bacterium]
MDPILSVVVPTRSRPEKLRACLDLLQLQSPDTPAFEVVVSLDGPCPESQAVCEEPREGLEVVVVEAPREGIAVAKNAAIERSRGHLLLLINDDILPEPEFVGSHIRAHEEREAAGLGPAMVLGHSPWLMPEEAEPGEAGGVTLFDRLLAQSSMIFFYDKMITEDGTVLGDRDTDWGYRHAWNLNLSLPTSLACVVGGFRPALANCCYEDIEFAWRVNRSVDGGVPVLFRPEARAPHDHRYTPRGYLERELRLGYAAFGFAKVSPECAAEVFLLELDSVDELGYAARFIAHEGRAAGRLREGFESLAQLPPSAAGEGEAGRLMLRLLEQQQLMLKRVAFRRGLILAAEGGRIEGLFHPLDELPTEPGLRPRAAV